MSLYAFRSFPCEPQQWNGDEPDPHPEGRRDPPVPFDGCDRCGASLQRKSIGPFPFGTFCSESCVQEAEAAYQRRRSRAAPV